jgi:hypothetical protein
VSRLVVVAPLEVGAHERASALIANGPPFELAGTALTAHDVYLTPQEAIFVFEGADARSAVERLVGDPGVWRAAPEWRAVLAGRPRLAAQIFAWRREEA